MGEFIIEPGTKNQEPGARNQDLRHKFGLQHRRT